MQISHQRGAENLGTENGHPVQDPERDWTAATRVFSATTNQRPFRPNWWRQFPPFRDAINYRDRPRKEVSKEVAELFWERGEKSLNAFRPTLPNMVSSPIISIPSYRCLGAEYSRDSLNLKKMRRRFWTVTILAWKGERAHHWTSGCAETENDMKSPIICLCMASVGKTSWAIDCRSAETQIHPDVARRSATKPRLRGHRRTYIGAMPGRIIQNLQRRGLLIPCFILDEIDKIEWPGATPNLPRWSARPEQNNTFRYFLDIDTTCPKIHYG